MGGGFLLCLLGPDPGAVEAERRLTQSWAEAGPHRDARVLTAEGVRPPTLTPSRCNLDGPCPWAVA